MIWMIASWLLLILSLMLIGVGLFWDRPGWRGRPKRWCSKCRYDLSDADDVPVTCSECGKVHERERSLHRVRRHKRGIAAGLLLLVCAPVPVLYPDYQKGEVFRRAPNWLLVELLPYFPTLQDDGNLLIKGNNPGVEMLMRLAGGWGPMTHEETRSLLSRIASGGLRTRPGSVLWQERVVTWMRGQWRRFENGGRYQYLDGTPADEALNAIFERFHSIYPEPNPSTRDRWVAGMPVVISSGIREAHWRAKLDRRLLTHVEWEVEGTEIRGESKYGVSTIRINGGLELGQSYTIRIKYSIFPSDRQLATGAMLGNPGAVFSYTRRWTMVSGLDEIFEGVDSALIRQVLIEEVVPAMPYKQAYREILNNPRLEQREFQDLAMGMQVILSDDQGVIRQFSQSWMKGDGRLTEMQGGIYNPLHDVREQEEAELRIYHAIENDTLRVRLIGDFQQSLWFFDADRAWDGEIDMLYSDAVKQHDAMLAEQQEDDQDTKGEDQP
ncbi:MAG: hypothetical protein CMJ25_12285 [Phycisphaerae bacterium]|nr:hypothetical protein [Phycisphaerae bacterium]